MIAGETVRQTAQLMLPLDQPVFARLMALTHCTAVVASKAADRLMEGISRIVTEGQAGTVRPSLHWCVNRMTDDKLRHFTRLRRTQLDGHRRRQRADPNAIESCSVVPFYHRDELAFERSVYREGHSLSPLDSRSGPGGPRWRHQEGPCSSEERLHGPPLPVAAIRLLMLTGCRKSVIRTLRWSNVDLNAGELRLAAPKTGARVVPLGPEARALLADLPREEGNLWVIRSKPPGSHITDLQRPWRRIRARNELEDVRIHDLRHTFASRALALRETLPVIGKLLGHSDIETTARYAHLAQDSIHETAERIAGSIAADIC